MDGKHLIARFEAWRKMVADDGKIVCYAPLATAATATAFSTPASGMLHLRNCDAGRNATGTGRDNSANGDTGEHDIIAGPYSANRTQGSMTSRSCPPLSSPTAG